MNQPLFLVALDGLADNEEETFNIADRFLLHIEEHFGFKVNLDYLLSPNKDLRTKIGNIQNWGRPLFVDLKMWNGSRTMMSVLEILVEMEVEYTNIYALADDLLKKALRVTEGSNTKVLGLTVLTHYNDAYCRRHFRRPLKETVRHFAEVAIKAGCHGIIVPGTTLEVVRDLNTTTLVPGIRPGWYSDARHEQEVTPGEAVDKGADILTCCSPIFKSSDQVGALQKILDEIAEHSVLL